MIWEEKAFPGHRFFYESGGGTVQSDVGFGGPLDPPADWLDYPGAGRVLAAREELVTARKHDGLFKHGAKRWQAKELFDLWLLTPLCPRDVVTLGRAIRTASATYGTALDAVDGLLFDSGWRQTPRSQARWAKSRGAVTMSGPAYLGAVAAAIGRRLRPVLAVSRTTEAGGPPMSSYFPEPDDLGRHTIFPGVGIRTAACERMMMSVVDMEPGAVVEAHSHPHEQVGMVIGGKAVFTVGVEERTLVTGDLYRIPGGVVHRVVASEEGLRALDIFTPVRDEYR